MTTSVMVAMDRSLIVEPGRRVVSGYVEVHKVRMACRDRMSVGDVEQAYRRQLQLGDSQVWPCPVGRWEGEQFVLYDGRHAYVAALMLGFTWLLVAWEE